MQIIPINDTPSQTVVVSLGGQNCEIDLFVKSTGMFCNVRVDGATIIDGVICQNLNRIVRDAYLGFVGDLYFNDTQGAADPTSPGLNTRYQFCYLEAGEI